MSRLDVVVIGAGPAGLSAALNLDQRNKKVVVYGMPSDHLTKAHVIDNHLGMPKMTGMEVDEVFRKHIKERNIEIREERIEGVYSMGDYFMLMLRNNEVIETNAVIIACGVILGKPVTGEKEFMGRGAGTCATCDAAIYAGRPVVVVGYNEESIGDTSFIAERASKTTFINKTGHEVKFDTDIEVLTSTPKELRGDTLARELELMDGTVIEADGFFFIRDAVSPDKLVPGVELDGPHIKVDRNMKSSIDGLFACGDIVGRPYQVSKSIGEGQIAGLSAASYLSELRKKDRK